jgi:hypothetical protein
MSLRRVSTIMLSPSSSGDVGWSAKSDWSNFPCTQGERLSENEFLLSVAV